MKKDNKKALYESIMASVAKEVKKVLNESYEDKFVDLGLPSGNKWAKYNEGVNENKLNKAENWFGVFEEYLDKKRYFPPSKEDFTELVKNTKQKWVKDFNGIKNLCGFLFKSNNGNELFLPACGYKRNLPAYGSENKGFYWTDENSLFTFVADKIKFMHVEPADFAQYSIHLVDHPTLLVEEP